MRAPQQGETDHSEALQSQYKTHTVDITGDKQLDQPNGQSSIVHS